MFKRFGLWAVSAFAPLLLLTPVACNSDEWGANDRAEEEVLEQRLERETVTENEPGQIGEPIEEERDLDAVPPAVDAEDTEYPTPNTTPWEDEQNEEQMQDEPRDEPVTDESAADVEDAEGLEAPDVDVETIDVPNPQPQSS